MQAALGIPTFNKTYLCLDIVKVFAKNVQLQTWWTISSACVILLILRTGKIGLLDERKIKIVKFAVISRKHFLK